MVDGKGAMRIGGALQRARVGSVGDRALHRCDSKGWGEGHGWEVCVTQHGKCHAYGRLQ